MADCASCGAPITSVQKFCRACGAQVGGNPPAAPPRDDSCLECGQPIAAGAKFCRQCGASTDRFSAALSDVVITERRSGGGVNAWLIGGMSLAACLALGAGVYFAWPLLRSPAAPDIAVVQSALVQQLPPFVHLETVGLGAVRRDDSSTPPTFDVQFSGSAVLTVSVYEQ